MFTQDYLKALLARSDIVHVARTVFPSGNTPVQRTEKSRYYWAKCEWHAEEIPSLSFVVKTQTAYCFACGRQIKNPIALLMEFTGCGFPEAVKRLMGITGYFPRDHRRMQSISRRMTKRAEKRAEK